MSAEPPSEIPPGPTLPPEAYRRMSLVLRVGLGASIVVLLASLGAYLAEHPSVPYLSVVDSNPILTYLGLGGLLSGIAQGHVEAYLTLGLLVLVATPIVRVISGFYFFERGHEREMAAVTLSVFLLLLFGLLVLGPLVR